MMTRSRFIITAIFLVILVIFIFFISQPKNGVLTITSATTPVILKINNQTYTLKDRVTTIQLPKDEYSYSIQKNDSQATFTGFIDLINQPSANIEVDYTIFSKEKVLESLCNIESNCPTKNDVVVKFFEKSQWAVLYNTKEGYVGILKRQSKYWEVIDYRSTGEAFESGYLPLSVEREVTKNAAENE